MARVVFAAVLFALVACAHAYQLEVSPNNTAIARGNGTCLDLTGLWSWPLKIQGPERRDANTKSHHYHYTFNPTADVACNHVPSVAVCQFAALPDAPITMEYPCGRRDQVVYLWNGYYQNGIADRAANVTVIYPGGATWRDVVLTLIEDPTAAKPVFSMLGESPYLSYNFEYRAKDIGFKSDMFPCF